MPALGIGRRRAHYAASTILLPPAVVVLTGQDGSWLLMDERSFDPEARP